MWGSRERIKLEPRCEHFELSFEIKFISAILEYRGLLMHAYLLIVP